MAVPNTNKESTTNNQLQDIIDLLTGLLNGGSCCVEEVSLLSSIQSDIKSMAIRDSTATTRDRVENTAMVRFAGASMVASIALYDTWKVANMDADFRVKSVIADTSVTLVVLYSKP